MVDYTEAEQIALGLAKPFEGFRANPYPDPATGAEPWTIGYGSTRDKDDMPVTPQTAPVTEGEACDLAMRDMYRAFTAISANLKVPLTTHETAAVMDFVYNVGFGNFRNSTMLRLINQRNFALAAKEFEKWDMAAGKVLAGLLRRRIAEEQVFEKKDS